MDSIIIEEGLDFLHSTLINRRVMSVLSILGFLFIGCGYVSTSDYLSHIDSITVTPVDIEDPDFTYERSTGKLYDEIVREAMIDRFSQKWRDGNDSQLDLIIRDYDIKAIDFAFPFSHCAVISIGPAGASIINLVIGSFIDTTPHSRTAVAAHIVL